MPLFSMPNCEVSQLGQYRTLYHGDVDGLDAGMKKPAMPEEQNDLRTQFEGQKFATSSEELVCVKR